MDLERKFFHLFSNEAYPFYLQLISNLGVFEFTELLTDPQLWKERLHWGLGVGVRTNTPLGPLALASVSRILENPRVRTIYVSISHCPWAESFGTASSMGQRGWGETENRGKQKNLVILNLFQDLCCNSPTC
jgi:hypothetical protein